MVEPSRSTPVKRPLNWVRTDLPCVSRREQLAWLDNPLQEGLAGQPCVVLHPAEAGIDETQIQKLRSVTLRRGSEAGYGHCTEVLAFPTPSVVEILQALHQPSLKLKRSLSTDLLDWVALHSGAELAHRRDQQMESCRTHGQQGVEACRLATGDNGKGQQGPALEQNAA